MPQRGRKKKKQSRFAIFYILTLLTGIVVCMVLFIVAFQAITSNNAVIEGSAKPTTIQAIVDDWEPASALGMIVALDSPSKTVTLLDLASGRKEDYQWLDTTDLRNKYGGAITFAEFDIGQIVDARFDGRTNELLALTISPQAWENRYASNVKVDTENNTLTLGNDTYDLHSQTLVLYKGEAYAVGNIQPLDTVSLTGYKNSVWCIRLDSSHGYIKLENTDLITGGILTVDSTIYRELGSTESIPLAEGTHKVIVEGTNIEPFVADVSVRPGETAYIDMANAELKKATLRVVVDEPDCVVIIDGNATDGRVAHTVTYGSHTVRVEKPDFIPVEQTVDINRAVTEIRIQMVQEVKDSYLTVESAPTQAEIYVDGVLFGISPVTRQIAYGTYTVIARKAGYQDSMIEVTVTETNNAVYLVMFEQRDEEILTLPALPDDVAPLETP